MIYSEDLRLTVLTDGKRVVVAEIKSDLGKTVTASAVCDPIDDWDYEIGFGLAVGRAIRQLGRGVLKEAQERVKREDTIKEQEQFLRELFKTQASERGAVYRGENLETAQAS